MGVAVGGTAVGVGVAVGGTAVGVGVAVGGTAVGVLVGVRPGVVTTDSRVSGSVGS